MVIMTLATKIIKIHLFLLLLFEGLVEYERYVSIVEPPAQCW